MILIIIDNFEDPQNQIKFFANFAENTYDVETCQNRGIALEILRNMLAHFGIFVWYSFLGSSFYNKQIIDTRTFLEVISGQGKSLCTLRSEVSDLKAFVLKQSNQMSKGLATLNAIASCIGAKATEPEDKNVAFVIRAKV